MRIISLISSATEIVSSLGCSEMLVGISHECDYPESIRHLPVCSEPKFNVDGSSIDVDKNIKSLLQDALSIYRINEKLISELNPDIIITQSQCDVCAVNLNDVQNSLNNNLGISPIIISLEPKNLHDIWINIKTVASKLNKYNQANEMINNFKKEIIKIKNRNMSQIKKRIACIEWIEPLMFAGNWVPEIVDIVGGNDLFGLMGQHSLWAEYQTLFDENPDKIIFMPCGYGINKTQIEIEKLFKLGEWNELRAVNSGDIYISDGSQYFNRPGPRILDSIKIMDEIINDQNLYGFLGKGWKKNDE